MRGTYKLMRACTCKRGQRGAECAEGYHEVSDGEDLDVLKREAAELQAEIGVAYHVRRRDRDERV